MGYKPLAMAISNRRSFARTSGATAPRAFGAIAQRASGAMLLWTVLALTSALPASAVETPTGNAETAPPTAPIVSATSSSGLPYRNYRLFVESLQFGGSDPQFASAQLTFNTAAGSQSLMIGPDWRAKEIAIQPHKPVPYGTSYYFPVGSPSSSQRLEGKIMMTARGSGLISVPKIIESFALAMDSSAIQGLKEITLTGDAGSRLTVRLYSPCDFNIYESLDLSGIRQALGDELNAAGARVFSESGGAYSRSSNAIWIGADVPQECAELARRVFSTNHGIPLKGVFTFNEADRGRYFFNPGSITLGHSNEVSDKPDLPKAQLSQLFNIAGRRTGS